MAAQKGFEYEKNAYNALLKFGISAGAPPAGAASDRADLEIKLSSEKSARKAEGCELKITTTAAGSLVLKYYNSKWAFGDFKGHVLNFLHKETDLPLKVQSSVVTSLALGS